MLCVTAVRAQEDPDASFKEAKGLMKEALQAKVASERSSLEARQKYEQALSSLKGLMVLSPNWNSDEVARAAEECQKALAQLTGDASRTAAASKAAPAPAFVGHRKTKKYHKPECRYVQKVAEGSRIFFSSREEAETAGFTACKSCKPNEGAASRAAESAGAEAVEKGLASGPFFGIPSSKKVHRADCKWSKKVADKNKVFFASCADALKAGYSPCKLCRPDETQAPAAAPPAAETPQAAAPAAAPPAPAAAGAYVASTNGKTFHRAECAWAKGIDPSALVSYKTKEEAAAGKKPCRICKP